MKVYQVIFDTDRPHIELLENGESKTTNEIVEEIHYWSASCMGSVCQIAEDEAKSFNKDLKSIREVLTVTRHLEQ